MSLHWQGGGPSGARRGHHPVYPKAPGHPVNPVHPGNAPGNAPAHAMMRASDADRERAADVLKAGFAEGRLGQAEYDQRLDRVHRAHTYGELHALLADLPQGPVPMTPQPPQPVVPRAFHPGPLPLPPTNGSATGALVCGILTPMTWGLTAIPAVVLGHKARSEMKYSGERGSGFATAGLVLGYLAIAFWGLMFLTGVGAALG